MLGKIFNDQTERYENHDKFPLSYYEIGIDTSTGRPVMKVFYDDGSYHLIDMTNGGLTSDSPFFVSQGNPLNDSITSYTLLLTADGDYSFPAQGGSDGSFVIAGNFGGGTVSLQYNVAGQIINYDNGSLTANGGFSLRWATDLNQITLSGSTSPSLTAIAHY